MKTLFTQHRKQLERTVIEARDVAEAGARVALEALAVHHHEPYGHMDSAQRRLRKRLRAHARQLGDRVDARTGVHSIDHLVHECAYEHWHGMLFARFLAENQLLIEPEMGIAISLDECEELAKEEGPNSKQDKWTLAARFAHRMLPQVFRPDHPVFELQLAREYRLKLEGLAEGVPAEVFAATDSLGWVYQFWQTKKKSEVNKSGNKIGAAELPAVTQLFTEDYMVDFLLDNTLGAWHAGKLLAANSKLAESAQSEDELRRAVSLPGRPWKYLRFTRPQSPSPLGGEGRGEGSSWTPAAGSFDGWPNTAKELKCLDPCMGSGHFVVAMFERLVALRMAEEKLDEKAAVSAVIQDNLFGLELDPRCTQIGAFNLALAAWRRVGYCTLPAMNLACSGLAPNAREADWLAIAGDNEKLKNGMQRLYRLFKNAPVLGSLINPRAGDSDLFVAEFHELQPLLEQALAQEVEDEAVLEMAVTARGLAKAAEILGGEFTLVATNVPYAGFKKQHPVLAEYTQRYADDAKHNLATVFVQRCLDFASSACTTAVVTQQNFLFLGSYKALRERLLETISIRMIAPLGAKAFVTPMWDFSVCLAIFSKHVPGDNSEICGIDAASVRSIKAKREHIRDSVCQIAIQSSQKTNPDCRITFSTSSGERLERYAFAMRGIVAGDLDFWIRYFWEVPIDSSHWRVLQTTFQNQKYYSGRTLAISWLTKGEGMLRPGSRNRAYGCDGVAVCRMGEIKASLYNGDLYDQNVATVVPISPEHLPAIWSYCSSKQYEADLREIDQKLNITNATLVKVPFDLAHWQKVAAEKYPHGLPKPFSSDPTQWLFNGRPKGSDQPLQVGVVRLLGYQWPRQTGSSFPDCPALGADGLEKLVDEDGIVCIPAVRGERPAHERVLNLLQAAWGGPHPGPLPGGEGEWNDAILAKLLADAGSTNLDDWLRNGFFEQHSKLFHHRPFVWHIWDGRKSDGFHALVNYHKLAAGGNEGRRVLESLTYSYLGDWINRQQDGVKRGEGGAEDRLVAALELQKRLAAILAGEPPFDLFVRWKPNEQQAIGWTPDINDGVRLNIRPFMAQDIPGGKKGAGILRTKPNIHWKKDRGKEPAREQAQYPWFWDNGQFTGERVNDVHFTLAEKQAAREQAEATLND